MATFTYIQVYDHLKNIASSHSQINTFGFGDMREMNTSGTINYPLMWVVPQGGVVRKTEVGNKFKILIMDLVKRGEANEIDVLNDTQQIALDVIASLRNSANEDWLLKEDSLNLEDFTERFTDSVAGWAIDLTLWVEFTADRCAIPGGIVTTSLQPCPTGAVTNSNASYNNTVASGATLTLADVTHTDTDGSSVVKPGMVAMVCTAEATDTFLNFVFGVGATADYTTTIVAGENGTYTAQTLTNVTSVTYKKNGNPATLPITVVATDTLNVIPVITNTALEARVKLTGTY